MSDTPEEWVGYVRTQDRIDFVKLNGPLTVPGGVTLDLPNAQTFALAVTTVGDPAGEVSCSTEFGGEPWRLSGTADARVFAGRATVGDAAGSFELRRVATWDVPTYRALSAQYGLADGRRISIHVNADDWVGTPILFYSERDRFVRALSRRARGAWSPSRWNCSGSPPTTAESMPSARSPPATTRRRR